MVLVTVFLPSFNHGKYLPETIKSVLNQTFKDFEFIIADDCSTDNSREIIEKFKEQDDRIKAIFHEKNMGMAENFNFGIETAQGKYLALIDSDDAWKENKLEKQLEILKKDDNLIVWTDGEIINSKGDPTGETFVKKHYALKKKKTGNIFIDLLRGNFILGSSLIFKKGNLGNIRYNEKFRINNEYQFFIDLAKKYSYYFIEESLTKYRVHATNTIRMNVKQLNKDAILIREYFLKKYGTEIPFTIRLRHHYIKIMRAYLKLGKIMITLLYIFRAMKKEFSLLRIK